MKMNSPKNKKTITKYIYSEPSLPKTSKTIWVICIGFLALFVWAWFFELEEVSTGSGKVIPSSKEQIIQSLEGGILTQLEVKEGDVVQKNQILAQLDPTRFESNVGEAQTLLTSAQATVARLKAEVNGTALHFPASVQKYPDLIKEETALYHSRKSNLDESLAGFLQALKLVEDELRMTEPLVIKGAASQVEVLRLKREANDLRNKMSDLKNQYFVQAREELAKANTDVETQQQIVKGRTDTLDRTIFKAPVRGVVKEIEVTTLGGVVPPNGKLMTIVPVDERLLIEARISPTDIAFIHPDQEALVKVSAYDYSIYGGLKGKVAIISPDTIRDEVKQDQFYYRVYIRTDADKLFNKEGNAFNITPGMIATVDVKTGHKTILDYLLKPFNKAKEALRER